jgi:iron complex transport system substrate-binding protein
LIVLRCVRAFVSVFGASIFFASLHFCATVQAAPAVVIDPGVPTSPIIDDEGRAIVLTAFARRVVTLAPSLTELMYAGGANEKLVGVSAYSDFPESARHKPQVADAAGISFEALLALKPDLVLAWKGGTRPADVLRLESFGIKVFAIEIRTLADVPRAVRLIGKLVGRPKFVDTPANFASAFEESLEKMQLASKNKTALKVFFEISQMPLMTVNGKHFISETMKLCGGENVFADVAQLVVEPSREELLKRGADVILRPASINKNVAHDKTLYAGLEAYAGGRIYPLNADWILRPGPRVLLAAEEICAALDQARTNMSTHKRVR